MFFSQHFCSFLMTVLQLLDDTVMYPIGLLAQLVKQTAIYCLSDNLQQSRSHCVVHIEVFYVIISLDS